MRRSLQGTFSAASELPFPIRFPFMPERDEGLFKYRKQIIKFPLGKAEQRLCSAIITKQIGYIFLLEK